MISVARQDNTLQIQRRDRQTPYRFYIASLTDALNLDDDVRFGFAYGTLTNHAEAGEDLFEVFVDHQRELAAFIASLYSQK